MSTSTNLRASQKYKKRSTLVTMFRQLRKNKGAIIGLVLMLGIVSLALLAPVIFDYQEDVIGMNIRSACRVHQPSIGSEPMIWAGTSWPGWCGEHAIQWR